MEAFITAQPIHLKGVCALCHKHSEVGMFHVKEKGKVEGTFTNRGNYICQDSQSCNNHLTSIEKVYEFVDRLRGHSFKARV